MYNQLPRLGYRQRSLDQTLKTYGDLSLMKNVDIALLYIDQIPREYFDDFRHDLDNDELRYHEESRPAEPFAALEWMIPTAIAVYVGKKFIDAILKRATDDFADAVYPRLKERVKNLVKKTLVRDKEMFQVASSSPKKITNKHSMSFSIYAETKTHSRVKFIFHDDSMLESDYESAVDEVFSLLERHHSDAEDQITVASEEKHRGGTLYLIYRKEESLWDVVDPVKEQLQRQAKRDATSEP
jgi:hypothetical protein